MIDFTTVVGVDKQHAEQLRLVWPTWRRFRPELLRQPLLLICDACFSIEKWKSRLGFLDHPSLSIELWDLPAVGQREKMISGLVFGAAQHVKTPWYVNLDTDAIAMGPSLWPRSEWFEENESGQAPVFVSSPWGYTKPPDAIDKLDQWANGLPALARFPPLELHPKPGWGMVRHKRIISWCFFCRSDWTREVAGYCGERLPIASQDTYLWYVAARRGDFYRRVQMTRHGWAHVRSNRKIKKICTSLLSI